jgi:hypothetical protein
MSFNWHRIGQSRDEGFHNSRKFPGQLQLQNGLIMVSEDNITKKWSRFLCHH